MSTSLRYGADESGTEQILAHLLRCDASFHPPLSARLDVPAYARKLDRLARRFEAWDHARLVGLVALYVDLARSAGFVSNVSVESAYRGQGVGSRLLGEAVLAARALGIGRIVLEVSRQAGDALALYARHGFAPLGDKTDGDCDNLRMQLDMKGMADERRA